MKYETGRPPPGQTATATRRTRRAKAMRAETSCSCRTPRPRGSGDIWPVQVEVDDRLVPGGRVELGLIDAAAVGLADSASSDIRATVVTSSVGRSSSV